MLHAGGAQAIFQTWRNYILTRHKSKMVPAIQPIYVSKDVRGPYFYFCMYLSGCGS